MTGTGFCPRCRASRRTRNGRYVEHYVDRVRCGLSGQPVGGWVEPAPAHVPDMCAHTSSMRRGDVRVCADCGAPS